MFSPVHNRPIQIERKPRFHFEASLQRSVIDWLTRLGKRGLIWFHPANERQCSPRAGAYLKLLGVKAGVPDLCLVRPGGSVAFLELKSRDGRQSPEQIAFQQLCETNGAPYAIARSIDEAVSTLTAWGCLRSSALTQKGPCETQQRRFAPCRVVGASDKNRRLEPSPSQQRPSLKTGRKQVVIA
jgi:hypothetical protein